MPFNIALILEQASNCSNVLREQANVEKSAHEENILRSRIGVTAKERMTNVSEDKNANNKSKYVNEDKYLSPKSACQ